MELRMNLEMDNQERVNSYLQKLGREIVQLRDSRTYWWISNLPIYKEEHGTRTKTVVSLDEHSLSLHKYLLKPKSQRCNQF